MNGGLSFIVSGVCGLLAGGLKLNKRVKQAQRFNCVDAFMPQLTDYERNVLLPKVQQEYNKIMYQGYNAAGHGTCHRNFVHYTSYAAIRSAWLDEHCRTIGLECPLTVIWYVTGQAREIARNNRMVMFRNRGY